MCLGMQVRCVLGWCCVFVTIRLMIRAPVQGVCTLDRLNLFNKTYKGFQGVVLSEFGVFVFIFFLTRCCSRFFPECPQPERSGRSPKRRRTSLLRQPERSGRSLKRSRTSLLRQPERSGLRHVRDRSQALRRLNSGIGLFYAESGFFDGKNRVFWRIGSKPFLWRILKTGEKARFRNVIEPLCISHVKK